MENSRKAKGKMVTVKQPVVAIVKKHKPKTR
jgi:hypothetical protein